MALRFSLGFVLLAATFASAAAAQRTNAPRAFVDAVTLQVEEQAPRFHVPVCAASFGLPAGYGAAVVARIRDVAQAAGAEIERDPDCRPNLIVMVANDSREVSEVLRRTRPDIYVGLDTIAIERMLATPGPVRAWQSSEAARAEGGASYNPRDDFLRQDVHLHHGVPASLLRATTRRDLKLSVVLFDVDAIDGLTLRQIADHAALRGLAPTRPPEMAGDETILALFRRDGRHDNALAELSGLDLAYLRALYRDDGASKGSVQRAALARMIERAFADER